MSKFCGKSGTHILTENNAPVKNIALFIVRFFTGSYLIISLNIFCSVPAEMSSERHGKEGDLNFQRNDGHNRSKFEF